MRRAGAALALIVLLLAACDGGGPEPAPPVTFAWRSAALPLPPGPPGTPVLRDVAGCAGAWFVVGAIRDGSDGTRPAAWTSTDGTTWSALPIEARTFYGGQNVLSAVACHGDRMAAVGAKTGGVHGNPRTSTWQRVPGGALREVPGDFQLFGGPDAVNVGRLSAGPAGFLLCGNRVSGAAVWVSADGGRFELQQGVPALASDASGATWANDAVATAGGWLVVGGVRPRGSTGRDALGWRSADGRSWSRMPAAGASPADEEMQRVVALGPAVVAAGVAGATFAVWRREGDGWRPAGSFGAVRTSGLPAVSGLAAAGDRLVAVVSDGAAYGMWVSADGGAGWRPAALPLAVRAATGNAVTLAARGTRMVLLSDDGATSRLFTTS